METQAETQKHPEATHKQETKTRPSDTLSLLSLIGFEAAIWNLGVALPVLFLIYSGNNLRLETSEQARLMGRALLCVGIGLFCGAIGMRKISPRISPILSYAPAFSLVAFSFYMMFHSALVTLQDITNGVTATVNFAPVFIYPAVLAMGLGAGLILGRIDADRLAIVEPALPRRKRTNRSETDASRRVSSLLPKPAVIALTIPVTMLLLTDGVFSAAQILSIIRWLPVWLFASLPLIFCLSWMIDIAIYTKKEVSEISEYPGPIHRFGYHALRAIARVNFKLLFHYKPIDASNVPEWGGVLLTANHSSFLDPLLLACGTDRLIQFIIYASYYRSFAHPLFRFLRCIPEDEGGQLGALRTGVRSLILGACIGIFPEGKVSTDGKLNLPMRGALFLAQHSGAPVIPVALKGAFKALPRGAWIPRFVNVTPIYGKPFAVPQELSKEAIEELTDKMMSDLAQKLEIEPPQKIAQNSEEKGPAPSNQTTTKAAAPAA